MEVMVIYVWQCMVALLYDCMCARWLWSIINEHTTATINMKGCTLMIDVEEHEQKRKRKKRKGKEKKRKKTKEKGVQGWIRTCDLLLVKPALLTTVLLLMC